MTSIVPFFDWIQRQFTLFYIKALIEIRYYKDWTRVITFFFEGFLGWSWDLWGHWKYSECTENLRTKKSFSGLRKLVTNPFKRISKRETTTRGLKHFQECFLDSPTGMELWSSVNDALYKSSAFVVFRIAKRRETGAPHFCSLWQMLSICCRSYCIQCWPVAAKPWMLMTILRSPGSIMNGPSYCRSYFRRDFEVILICIFHVRWLVRTLETTLLAKWVVVVVIQLELVP